jgi:hypothetical protein
MISQYDLFKKFKDVKKGTKVFVSYSAGNPPTQKAISESEIARKSGFNLRHFTGEFEKLDINKNNQLFLVIKTPERELDSQPCFRAFNPSIGKIFVAEIL